MSIELQNAVLTVLNKEPCSTKAILAAVTDFPDRAACSTFLGKMYKHGLIKKQHNSYWKLTNKGIGLLNGMDVEIDTQLDAQPDSHNTQAEPETARPTDESLPKTMAEPMKILPNQPEPNTVKPVILSTWPSIDDLQARIPETASLVIERGAAFFVFANHQFELTQDGDFEAFSRMTECHIGNVNSEKLLKTGS